MTFRKLLFLIFEQNRGRIMMKINIAKYVIAVYSIVYGAVGMIGPMPYGPEVFVYIAQSLIIAVGALLLIPFSLKAMKIQLIVSIAIYGLMAIAGFVVLFIIPLAGLLVFAVIAIPLTLGILSLMWLNKEKDTNKKTSD